VREQGRRWSARCVSREGRFYLLRVLPYTYGVRAKARGGDAHRSEVLKRTESSACAVLSAGGGVLDRTPSGQGRDGKIFGWNHGAKCCTAYYTTEEGHRPHASFLEPPDHRGRDRTSDPPGVMNGESIAPFETVRVHNTASLEVR